MKCRIGSPDAQSHLSWPRGVLRIRSNRISGHPSETWPDSDPSGLLTDGWPDIRSIRWRESKYEPSDPCLFWKECYTRCEDCRILEIEKKILWNGYRQKRKWSAGWLHKRRKKKKFKNRKKNFCGTGNAKKGKWSAFPSSLKFGNHVIRPALRIRPEL